MCITCWLVEVEFTIICKFDFSCKGYCSKIIHTCEDSFQVYLRKNKSTTVCTIKNRNIAKIMISNAVFLLK